LKCAPRAYIRARVLTRAYVCVCPATCGAAHPQRFTAAPPLCFDALRLPRQCAPRGSASRANGRRTARSCAGGSEYKGPFVAIGASERVNGRRGCGRGGAAAL
jgi:hypothetical protein